jgi:hypothetical protein
MLITSPRKNQLTYQSHRRIKPDYNQRKFVSKSASAKETCVGLCVKWPLLFSSVGIYQQISVKSPVPDFFKIHSAVLELLRADG